MAKKKQGWFAKLKSNWFAKTEAKTEQRTEITINGAKYKSLADYNAALTNGKIKIGNTDFFYKVKHDIDLQECNDGTKNGKVKYAHLVLSETKEFKKEQTLVIESSKSPSLLHNFDDKLYFTQQHFQNKTDVSLDDISKYVSSKNYNEDINNFIDNAVREKIPEPYLAPKEDVEQTIKIGKVDFHAKIIYDVNSSSLVIVENKNDKESTVIKSKKGKGEDFTTPLFFAKKEFENKEDVSVKDVQKYFDCRYDIDKHRFVTTEINKLKAITAAPAKDQLKVLTDYAIKENKVPWQSKLEAGTQPPHNPVTQKPMQGNNLLQAALHQSVLGVNDPRYVTAKQLQSGMSIKKDAVPLKLEFVNKQGKTCTTTYYNCSQIEGCNKYIAPEKSNLSAQVVPQLKCSNTRYQYKADMACYMQAILSGKSFLPEVINRDNKDIKTLSGSDLKRMSFEAKNIALAALAPKKEIQQEHTQQRSQGQSMSM